MFSFWNMKGRKTEESVQESVQKPYRVIRHDSAYESKAFAENKQESKKVWAWEQLCKAADFESRRTSTTFSVDGQVYGRREQDRLCEKREKNVGRISCRDCSETNSLGRFYDFNQYVNKIQYSRQFREQSNSEVWNEDLIYKAFSNLRGLNVEERGFL